MPFEYAIDSDPFQAHLDRGWELLQRGDTAGAQLSARKSLELDADSPDAHNLLGYALAADGQTDEALEHYQEAIGLDDTFVDAMLNAADLLLRPGGDPEAALTLIEDALDLLDEEDDLSEFADALLLKADTLMLLDRKDDALRTLRRIPDAAKVDNAMLAFMTGRAFLDLGIVGEAAPALEAAVAALPQHGDAHYALALLREKQQDATGALPAFLRCQQLDLRDPPVPWSMPTDQFEKLAQEVVATVSGVPDDIWIHVTDLPGAEVVSDGVDPRAGVLLDIPQGERAEQGRPTLLFVYQRNIERVAGDLPQIREALEQALKHEVESLQGTPRT